MDRVLNAFTLCHNCLLKAWNAWIFILQKLLPNCRVTLLAQELHQNATMLTLLRMQAMRKTESWAMRLTKRMLETLQQAPAVISHSVRRKVLLWAWRPGHVMSLFSKCWSSCIKIMLLGHRKCNGECHTRQRWKLCYSEASGSMCVPCPQILHSAKTLTPTSWTCKAQRRHLEKPSILSVRDYCRKDELSIHACIPEDIWGPQQLTQLVAIIYLREYCPQYSEMSPLPQTRSQSSSTQKGLARERRG